MSLPSFSIKRPVTTIMAVIIIIILGFVSLGKTNIDLLPDVEFPIAVVITTYPGATSEEVESMVTKPVEKMISSAENIKSITSTSDPNVSVIEVTFNWGVDLDIATMELREKLDLAKKTLPDGADEPVVSKMDPSLMPALVVGLLGDRSDTLLKQIAEDEIVKPIERLEGVSAVRIVGGVERQIRVFLMPDKMEGYGISINQVTETLKLQNMSIPGGSVDYGGRELLVRTSGEFEDVDEIKNLIVANRQGAIVYLKDIAEVKDGTEDRNTYARINEKQGLRILIQKQSDANTVRVAETVKKELDKIEKRLPGDIEMYEILDQSDFINRAINTVKSNAIQGAILAIIIIFVFLHNIRSTLIIAVSIPISIIATFVIMYFMGISLNLMSLGGLAVGVGMLVDNTIVVLENVYRHQQLGKGRVEAAEVGASEVGLAIIASTLTTIAVFLPIVFIEGITRTLFKELSLTITFSLVCSLLVAQTLVPMLCSRFVTIEENNGKNNSKIQAVFRKSDELYEKTLNGYKRLLRWAMSHRRLTVAVMLGLFLLSIAMYPIVGSEFFPETDEGKISIDIELDKGTLVEKTNEMMSQIEKIALEIPEVETVSSQVGTTTVKSFLGMGAGEIGSMDIKLVSMKERKRSTKDVMEELRNKIGNISGADINISSGSLVNRMGSATGGDKPLQVNIMGDDFETLEVLSDQVAAIVKKVPGTRDVDTSASKGRPEVMIRLDREKASLYGYDAGKMALLIRSSINGVVATEYKVAGTEIDVNVQLEEASRKTLEDLKNMPILTQYGVSVPLSYIADIEVTEGYDTIKREDQERIIYVSSDVYKRSLGDVVKDIQAKIDDVPLPDGYSIEIEGQHKLMEEAFGELTLALVLAVILVYAVMAAQFESFIYPFTIMFTVPFAAIGVVLGLLLTGRSFNVPAFMGIIMLAGIVVNNAIVLVDYINQLKSEGVPAREAIIQAGPTRLRPVLMTTLTTVLGLVPLALGIGEGAEIQAPLATVVIGGLLASTLLTLIATPVIYSLVDDVILSIKRKLGKKTVEDNSVKF